MNQVSTCFNMAFKSNRELLNVNFEGYKLSEKNLRQICSDLPDGVKRKRLSNDCFSYQHVRRATMSNLLVPDQWNTSMVYWTSETNKIMSAFLQSPDVACIRSVFTTDKYHTPFEQDNKPIAVSSPSSLVFLSVSKALFYDPTLNPNNILLLNTGNRNDAGVLGNTTTPPSWQVICQITPPTLDFVVESAKINDNILNMIISSLDLQSTNSNCTIQYIRADLGYSHVNSTVMWILNASTSPLYCAIFNTAILIVSESDLVSQSSNLTSSEIQNTENSEKTEVSTSHSGLGYSTDYTWDQLEDDVTVTIVLSDNITKQDISCVIETDSLVVGLTDGTTFIRGRLFDVIDPAASTWTIENNRLEITLEKVHQGVEWSSLISTCDSSSGGVKGELPLWRNVLGLTENEMKQLTDRLDATCRDEVERNEGKRESNGPTDSPSKHPKPIFQNTMEDCDVSNDQEIKCVLISMDGQIINKTSLGGKELLFTLPQSCYDSSAILCLKHDIDTLVFSSQLTSDSSLQWNHTHTFNALGYVQASKRDKKFLTCDSEFTYSVLTDCNKHVFVYLKPSDGVKGRTALQYVHTLKTGDEILGVYANEGVAFILCENILYLLSLPE